MARAKEYNTGKIESRQACHYAQCHSIYRCFTTAKASFNKSLSTHFELWHKKT